MSTLSTSKTPSGRAIYFTTDLLAAAAAWTCFFLFRKVYNEKLPFDWELLNAARYYKGVIILPLCWTFVYAAFDSYKSIYRLSRLTELFKTIGIGFVGTVFLFFTFLLDDYFAEKPTYVNSFLVLFGLHVGLTLTARMIILTAASRKLREGRVAFNTLIIGGGRNAVELYQEIKQMKQRVGFKFTGFIALQNDNDLANHLPCLGDLTQLDAIIREAHIEDVIVAIDSTEHSKLREVVNKLYAHKVIVRLLPDMFDIMRGAVKTTNVHGAVLIELYPEVLPTWQRLVKRGIDLLTSSIFLIFFSPLYAYIAWRVKRSSKGPIFYEQDRIGQHGKVFRIIKFRSMFTDAEKNGAQLSDTDDPRVTLWGRTMRKYRLDELPQFWNVLRGEMSLVGPRPERQHFIDLIKEKAPHVTQLQRVRPGITSWGQVKYGYASNVDEMVKRLRYDILYIENMSLVLDIKILFYTILVVLQGRGK